MPTAKPRITITLEPEQHALLQRLAKLQRASMSSLVVELVDTVCPVLERVCDTIEAAHGVKGEALEGLKRSAEQAEAAMGVQLVEVLGQFDAFKDEIDRARSSGAEGGGVRQDAPQSSPLPAAVDPRPVITGVRSPNPLPPPIPRKPRKAPSQARRAGGVR